MYIDLLFNKTTIAALAAFLVGLGWWQLLGHASNGAGQERLRLVVEKPAGNEQHPIGFWIAKDFFAQEPVPEIVLFGDSQLGGLRAADAKAAGRKLDFCLDHQSYALQEALAQKLGKEPKVFVAAQPGSLISDFFVMIKSLFSKTRKPGLVVLAVSPREFLDNGLEYPGDSAYFRFFASYADLAEATSLAYPNFGTKLQANLKMMTRKPIPSVTPSQFVFAPDDKQVYRSVDPVYSLYSMGVENCSHQIRFLAETLKGLEGLGIETVVVFMPIPECEYNFEVKKFAHELLAPIATLCKEHGAHFFDMHGSETKFGKSDFLDPIHFSQEGGENFAKELASCIADGTCGSKF